MKTKPKFDAYIHGSGSLYLFCPLSEVATEWLNEHCSTEEHQYLGRNLAVEHRYIGSIIELAQQDGLTVRF